jgi:hypothetical protein
VAERWRVFGLVRAVHEWETRFRPADEEVLALYEWCFRCMEDGPPGAPEGAVRSAIDPEELYSYRVPGAQALASYWVVTQDRTFILRSIVSA